MEFAFGAFGKLHPWQKGKHLLTIIMPDMRVWKSSERRLNMECFPSPQKTWYGPSAPWQPLAKKKDENSHKQIYTNEAATLWHLPIEVSSLFFTWECVWVCGCWWCECVCVCVCAVEGPGWELFMAEIIYLLHIFHIQSFKEINQQGSSYNSLCNAYSKNKYNTK